MIRLTTLFSSRCCGGPVMILSFAFASFGMLFGILSALMLSLVFISIGIGSFGLCMWLGQSRCPQTRELGRAV